MFMHGKLTATWDNNSSKSDTTFLRFADDGLRRVLGAMEGGSFPLKADGVGAFKCCFERHSRTSGAARGYLPSRYNASGLAWPECPCVPAARFPKTKLLLERTDS